MPASHQVPGFSWVVVVLVLNVIQPWRRVGTRIAGLVPFAGDWILRIARGGDELSAVTLVRFFGTHIWVLPAALVTLIGVHLYLVIRVGISAPPEKDE
jgi:ubiquinol-cytochrome c reductase cytochrome b subunit